jgi:hypothetical protein
LAPAGKADGRAVMASGSMAQKNLVKARQAPLFISATSLLTRPLAVVLSLGDRELHRCRLVGFSVIAAGYMDSFMSSIKTAVAVLCTATRLRVKSTCRLIGPGMDRLAMH